MSLSLFVVAPCHEFALGFCFLVSFCFFLNHGLLFELQGGSRVPVAEPNRRLHGPPLAVCCETCARLVHARVRFRCCWFSFTIISAFVFRFVFLVYDGAPSSVVLLGVGSLSL